ncbi:hypothetical protein GGI42DRAFT_335403 [Trichoderma sp. SZMC 28013]
MVNRSMGWLGSPFYVYLNRWRHKGSKRRMVRPFLPKIPIKDYERGVRQLEYLLVSKGYKTFQKLMEDVSPYGPLTPQIETTYRLDTNFLC